MRAAVLSEANTPLVIEDVEAIGFGPHDVLVRVGASGICHSDLTFIQRGMNSGPIVLGHEGAGVVERVGEQVTGLAAGDRVIASWVAACGRCYWCQRDEANLCVEFSVAGRPAVWRTRDGRQLGTMTGIGTMAEQILAHERALVKVSTDLPDDQLALIGCGVTTGVCAALNAAAVKPGSSVAVVGCGGVGTAIIQGARIAGATTIIAVDPVALKRETACRLGATHAVDPSAVNAPDAIRDLTEGRGTDYGFEATGRVDAADLAYASVRRGGTFVNVGGGVPSDLTDGLFGSKRVLSTLYGHANPHRDMPMLVRMAETGQLNLGSMVSQRISLDEVNAGVAAIESGTVIRSVIGFGG